MELTSTQTSVNDLEIISTRCIACNSSKNVKSFHCGHPFCLDCFKRFFEFPLKEGELLLQCPFCCLNLTDDDISTFDQKLADDLSHKNIQNALGPNANIQKCPSCKEMFQYEPGEAAYITKDEFGNPITGEALECLKNYRCTCPQCHKNFCVNCGASPFHEGITCRLYKLEQEGVYCRFCNKAFEGCDKLDPAHRICQKPDCQKWKDQCCMHILECGHPCPGIRDEKEHIVCGECSFEVCCICAEPLNSMPSIKLKCGHYSHLLCAQETVKSASSTNLISLPLCKYPHCEQVIESPLIDSKIFITLHQKIEALIPKLVESEHVKEDPHVVNPDDDDYFNQPEKFVREKFAFYVCQSCGEPFYGGMKACNDEKPPDAPVGDCLCEKCSKIGASECPKHGREYMVYKCFFCCRPAAFHCWGTTHFCEECHKDPSGAQKGPYMQCDGKCPFSPHPPNGTRQYFGYCRMCQSGGNH